ncbi:MAG: exonuclease domain-containing protein [Firmicutes bacterium]|nr:exonuclease domain-containing protein [Bacillota bacterium]
MKTFLEKFNSETNDRFSYIKLREVNISVRKRQIELVLLYPESYSSVSEEDRGAIASAAQKVLNSPANVMVKLVKSHFDAEDFTARMVEFFKKIPPLATTVTAESIEAGVNSGGAFARISVDPVIFEYCEGAGTAAEVQKFLGRSYCEPVAFSFVKKGDAGVRAPEPEADPEGPALAPEKPGGRFIVPQNVDALIGAPIYERAAYIEDAKNPRESLTVCGTLTEFSQFAYRAKDGSEKNFYKLSLADFTGTIEGIYFPNKYTANKIGLLKQGKQVAVRGSLEPDKKNAGKLMMVIKDISYCTLPDDLVPNRLIRSVSPRYQAVFPKPYEVFSQGSLFDGAAASIGVPAALLGKTLVVFDLETTGLSAQNDCIIEIGAVKIVNGRITETFSSLIDPETPIPEAASKINGIKDADVEGKPKIEQVLPDFYKFVDGAELVAHNIPFDLGFIADKGKSLGIFFDHPKHDTVTLARKTFPGLPHYNLGFLTEQLKIELTNAHRALDDALATARLFLRIFEKAG